MVALGTRPAGREHRLVAAGAVLATVVAIAAVWAAFDAVVHLHMMTDQLGTVGQRLTALDSMDRKLGRLATMQRRLEAVDGRLVRVGTTLDRTNAKLDQTNAKLDQTNARLDAALARLHGTQTSLARMDGRLGSVSTQMQRVDADLRSMRGDIHVMAHKIDGSFLFRGVK